MDLSEHFTDLICAFNDENVRFLVVGAYAMSAQGFPRATGDIDFWVEPTIENAQAVIRALEAFKAPFELTVAELCREDMVFFMGKAPERIDILTNVSGLTFSEAYANSKLTTFEDAQVRVLSLEDLIANKRASGRIKDLVDLAALIDLKKNQ